MPTDGELPLIRRNGKSEAAFRTISEVAEELDVPQHVLRFWESKFPQVKPLKRGGGRRYYRPEDVLLLKRIRHFLYSEGYTIKGVQKLLREGGGKDTALDEDDGTPDRVTAGEPPEAAHPEPEPQPEPEAEPEPAPMPSIGREEDDLPAMDDGEGEGEGEDDDVSTDQAAPQPRAESHRMSPDLRRELTGILNELEQLRRLLDEGKDGACGARGS